MTASVIVVETLQCCCNPYRHHEIYQTCNGCCKKCKACCRKKKNVNIKPVEVPSVHIMIRNPYGPMTLGTPASTPIQETRLS